MQGEEGTTLTIRLGSGGNQGADQQDRRLGVLRCRIRFCDPVKSLLERTINPIPQPLSACNIPFIILSKLNTPRLISGDEDGGG
jgi:hypothetical protein